MSEENNAPIIIVSSAVTNMIKNLNYTAERRIKKAVTKVKSMNKINHNDISSYASLLKNDEKVLVEETIDEEEPVEEVEEVPEVDKGKTDDAIFWDMIKSIGVDLQTNRVKLSSYEFHRNIAKEGKKLKFIKLYPVYRAILEERLAPILAENKLDAYLHKLIPFFICSGIELFTSVMETPTLALYYANDDVYINMRNYVCC